VHRHELTEGQWLKLEPLLPRRGRRATRGDRNFINAVLYLMKTGSPWRDLPERYGSWKTVYNRFARWSKRGHFERVFKALQLERDPDGTLFDGSIVRAHQDAAGGKGGPDAKLWAALVEVFRPSSTPQPTRKAGRSTSS
jgi:putative transposase